MIEFEEVYRRYFTDVFLYIRQLSQDEQVAEEITSRTFFKAMGGIKHFRGDCDIRVWLCQIAKNTYFSYLKETGRSTGIDHRELENLPQPGDTMEENMEIKAEAAEIRMILHRIPDTYKEVFMWRVFAQLSFKEIGQLFGKTENWACVTYHRAKTMIRKRLEDNHHEA